MAELLEMFSQNKLINSKNIEYEIRHVSEVSLSCDIDKKQYYLEGVSKHNFTELAETILRNLK